MQAVKVKIIGSVEGVYVDPRTCESFFDLEACKNYSAIPADKIKYVNHATIMRSKNGDSIVVSISGYSPDTGTYYVLFPIYDVEPEDILSIGRGMV